MPLTTCDQQIDGESVLVAGWRLLYERERALFCAVSMPRSRQLSEVELPLHAPLPVATARLPDLLLLPLLTRTSRPRSLRDVPAAKRCRCTVSAAVELMSRWWYRPRT